jgi:chromosome partitioning protein
MIIVLAGEKGGPGKSAISTNLVVCMLLRGDDSLLLDADLQRTSARFCERRDALAKADPTSGTFSIPHAEKKGDMVSTLESLAPRYKHIVVDVRGTDTPQLASALMMADVVYSPFSASISDLETAEAMSHAIELSKARGNRALRSYGLLSKIEPGSGRAAEVAYCLEMLEPYAQHLPIVEPIICRRKIFKSAAIAGRGVVEFASHKSATVRRDAAKSTEELWALYALITGNVATITTTEESHEQASAD